MGLIKIKTSSPLAWVVTEKGREFLKKYEDFRELLSP